KKSKFADAAEQYRKALFIDPKNGVAEGHLGRTLAAVGLDPDDFKVRRRLANEALEAGDLVSAIAELAIVTKMTGNSEDFYQLGKTLLRAGKVVTAISEFAHALRG